MCQRGNPWWLCSSHQEARASFPCPGRDWLPRICLQPGPAPCTTPGGAIQWYDMPLAPLPPHSRLEAPVCLGNRGTCLRKGPRAISLGAGRERTFTGFLPSRGPQTSDWMSRTDLPFPSSCRSQARGEMGTPSTGPCPGRQHPRAPGAGAGWGPGSREAGGLVRAV